MSAASQARDKYWRRICSHVFYSHVQFDVYKLNVVAESKWKIWYNKQKL